MADFYNSLLKRREVIAILSSIGNPGIVQSSKFISEKFKVGEDVISVKRIENNYGSKEFSVHAFIYDSLDDKAKVEPKLKEVKAAV